MAPDNEDIKKNNETEPKEESLIEKALDKINTDFPLSGGETDEDLEDPVKDPSEKPEHESWIEKTLDDINKEFPLSGGETEEDLK